MRIAIDATAPVIGGGITWLREAVPALWRAAPRDEFLLLIRSDIQNIFDENLSNLHAVPIKVPQRLRPVWRLLWQQTVLPLWLNNIGAGVLLSPNDICPLLSPCKIILGIQNANPYYGPPAATWLGRRREQFLRWQTKLSAWRAEKVFFVSEWSRQIISRKLRLPLEKSCVIYHGVSERFRPGEEKLDKRGKESSLYVLVVGSVRSHKDYITLLKAWKLIVKSKNQYIKLLIVGPILDSRYYQELISLLHTLQISESVSFVMGVPPSEMPALYQEAFVLVMPSYVETFGLPMLEAMACGIPVIASDIPVAREVCGEAAYYYRLGDPDDLAEKLLSVLGDPSKRSELIEAGRERAQHFSWDKVAVELLQLLKSVL